MHALKQSYQISDSEDVDVPDHKRLRKLAGQLDTFVKRIPSYDIALNSKVDCISHFINYGGHSHIR